MVSNNIEVSETASRVIEIASDLSYDPPITKDELFQENEVQMEVVALSHWYGDNQVLSDISMPIFKNKVTAIIGPSGCGKSTFLRDLNRMNDLVSISRISGDILLGNKNIYDDDIDVVQLRKRIGMVFQKPNPQF